MRNLTYILPICLCCFPLLGQEQSGHSTVRTNAIQSRRVVQSQDPMLEKYRQHEGWVKLTAAIDRQKVIANKLKPQIDAQAQVIRAKMNARQDYSADQRRQAELRKSYTPVVSQIDKMEKERNVIEAQIKLRESNKK
jgi:predicted RNase H-like nuclease (RuvC/YqgF family)